MKSNRTTPEIAAGKLVSAIQREWTSEAGEPAAEASEAVLHSAHRLLLAAKEGNVGSVIGTKSISEFLGTTWFDLTLAFGLTCKCSK